jgi:hypothetical protein
MKRYRRLGLPGPSTLLASGCARAVIALAVLAAVPGEARAAFPGTNGFIAFQSNRDSPIYDPNYFEIYLMNTDGSSQIRLTTSGGRSVMVTRRQEDRVCERPRQQPRDLRDECRRLGPDAPNRDTECDGCIPVGLDGSKIAFATLIAAPGANYDIWVMNSDGTEAASITIHPAEDPTFLVSRRVEVAFRTNRDGGSRDPRCELRRYRPDERQQEPADP